MTKDSGRDPAKKYNFILTRQTVDKLGVKLYDKAAAVVAELVANAYDADAEDVKIELPLSTRLAKKDRDTGEAVDGGYYIRVSDDGHGMTPDEVNDFYLQVGKERRADSRQGPESRKKRRPVMGRKGVGKLAPFGICKRVEVWTAGGEMTAKGYRVAHLFLEYEDILNETEFDEPYHPRPGPQDETWAPKSGTTITLTDFNPHVVPDKDTFDRQLSARFGLKRTDWTVRVTDTRGQIKAFDVGTIAPALDRGTKVDASKYPIEVHDDEGELVETLKATGWMAKSKEPFKDPESAGVRVYARGKIVAQTRDFGSKSGFTGEHTIRSYLVGELHCEFLDEEEDLIKTDRQDILWESERGRAFQAWGLARLKEVAELSLEPARTNAREVFLEKSNLADLAKEAYDDPELQKAVVEVGKLLGGTTSMDELKNEAHVERLANLCVTIAPHRALIEALSEAANAKDLTGTALLEQLTRAGIAEDASLGQVARIRLEAIDQIKAATAAKKRELVLQKIIEQAPWLIEPQWTALTMNQTFVTIREEFPPWYEEEYGERVEIRTEIFNVNVEEDQRPDFVMLALENRLVLVELKRPGRKLPNDEWERLADYHTAMEEFLEAHPQFKAHFPNGVETVLIADEVSLNSSNKKAFRGMQNDGELIWLKWTEFLSRTRTAHQDFIEARSRGARRSS